MKKGIVSLVLCVTMLFSLCAGAFADGVAFNDVKEGEWFYDAVCFVSERGYLEGVGDGNFGPAVTMTRAMFAVMIYKFAEGTPAEGNHYFVDVDEDEWYAEAVNWAYENKVLSGVGDGKFMPNADITREQAVVMLRSLGGFLNYDVTYTDDTMLKLFHDNNEISGYAHSAVAWAVDFGLLSGGNDHALMPKKSLTRAECAVIIAKFTDYETTPPITPPVIRKVTFKNFDGAILYTDYIADGGNARYRAATPKRTGDKYHSYTFKKWDKPLSPINSDTVFTAIFEEKDVYYTVKFVNWDGKLLYTTSVKAGQNAVYKGSTPKKPENSDYTYTFSGWDKSMNNILANTTLKAKFTSESKSKRKIDPNKPMIALTFDDGPGAGSASILDTVEKYNIAVTFFDVGTNIYRYPNIVRRAVSLECEIGNHTYNHPNLRNCSYATIRNEIDSTNNAYKSVLGYAPTLMRPPYGATNASVNSAVNMKIILWSIDTLDWKSRNANSVYNVAVGEAYDGAIILMHSLYTSTADAVKRIVPTLLSRGYQLVTVSELAKYKGYTMVNGKSYAHFK